jgi:hypothetical protein
MYLVFLKTVLEDVLHHQTARLSKGDFVPHTAESFIDVAHDLRWRIAPAKLEQLLPDMASIAVDHSLWNATKQFMDHGGFVFLGHAVESLLDDVAAEGIHTQSESISTNGLRDSNDLLRSTVLEAALHQEVAEAIDHQWVSLGDDCLDNLILLLWCTDFELLLQEDGCLLIVVTDNLVDNILPSAAHVAVEQTTIVHGLYGRDVLWNARLTRSL